MIQLTRLTLLVGMAASLTAQTLSFGEITLVTPATTPPTYVVNVILTTSGTAAGAQFDLNYDPTQLNVTIGPGAAAAAASKEVSTTMLPAANNPFCVNPGSCVQQANAGPGQRAIITGVGLTDSAVSSVGGPSLIADGSVATLTVQATGSATTTGQTLTLMGPYLGATTAGALNTAAVAIPLTIGAGSSDPGATGILNLYGIYLVGGVYPSTSDTSPSFGSGAIALNDVLSILFAFDGLSISGFPNPVCGTDRFDAMDTYPQDTLTTRGGARTGKLTLNDVLTDLFTFDKLTGYGTLPVRVSAPYTCPVPGGGSAPAGTLTARTAVRPPPEVAATLVFGATEGAGTGADRIPVYLESRRDLNKLAITFGAGDQQSKWQFQPASGVAPSVLQDSTSGVSGALAVAWLQGLDIRAGQRMLLGYIVGPSGSAGNLRVLGMGASLIDGLQEVGLEVSGVAVAQQ